MSNNATLKSYDVLMLPCEGGQYIQPADQLANIIDFTSSGGRVYASHFEYVWMFQNGPFAGVVNWKVGQAQLQNGTRHRRPDLLRRRHACAVAAARRGVHHRRTDSHLHPAP